MKKNRYNRRASALKRLKEQITTHRMSSEFYDTLDGLSTKEKEDKIVLYWEKKGKEYSNLCKKIGQI